MTTAEVPRPDQPLPSPSDGYNNSIPDVLVRLDVTYLRQDFSLLQPVANANPWPAMQRFDYLVQSRIVSEEEATAFSGWVCGPEGTTLRSPKAESLVMAKALSNVMRLQPFPK